MLHLAQSQQEVARAEAERVQRAHEADLAKAAAASSARSVSKRRADKEKAKQKPNGVNGNASLPPTDSSATAKPNGRSPSTRASSVASSRAAPRSPTGSPPQPQPQSQPRHARHASMTASAAETGFSGLRSSLSRYLSGAPQEAVATGTGRGAWALLGARLEALYAADPVRLLSFVCAAVAVVSWVRRVVAARQGRGERKWGLSLGVGEGVAGLLRGVGARVVETVRMGTKVTTL